MTPYEQAVEEDLTRYRRRIVELKVAVDQCLEAMRLLSRNGGIPGLSEHEMAIVANASKRGSEALER